jgi:hypothetical protein
MDIAFKDKLFTSFSELQNAIQEYEEKNCVQIYKRTSSFRELAQPELATSTHKIIIDMKKVTNRKLLTEPNATIYDRYFK